MVLSQAAIFDILDENFKVGWPTPSNGVRWLRDYMSGGVAEWLKALVC